MRLPWGYRGRNRNIICQSIYKTNETTPAWEQLPASPFSLAHTGKPPTPSLAREGGKAIQEPSGKIPEGVSTKIYQLFLYLKEKTSSKLLNSEARRASAKLLNSKK
jgi:hypothetical protein